MRQNAALCGNGLTLYHTTQLKVTMKEKPFENIVGEGENAGNQHFLLFPQCFLSFPKQISTFQFHLVYRLQMLSIWASLKFCCLAKSKLFSTQSPLFITLACCTYEKHCNQHFLLFPQCFLPTESKFQP